jgi:NADH-ubiquinone oxidoreductase chain 4
MITLLLLIPILGSLIILPMSNTIESKNYMRKIALTTSLINFFISLFIWYHFDSSQTQYQFVTNWGIQEFNQLNFFHLNFGIDGISLYFVLLTTFVTPIALLSNYTNINNNLKFFLISFLLLETLQICAFASLDLLLFYIFFESVLPVLFIVIVIFGHGNDRFRSAFLFFLYTLAGSLPMLLCILMIYNYIGSTDFQLISLYSISLDSQKILWLSIPLQQGTILTSRINIKNKKTSSTNLLERFPRSNKNYLPNNNKCKDLVLFGSNFTCKVNYPRYTTIVRHMIKIPTNLQSVILGILLSDGHLYINKAGNTLLSFKQSMIHIKFFLFVYNKFNYFCNSYPKLDRTTVNGKIYTGIFFATRVFPCFTEWYEIFYMKKTKIVPLDLYNMLTYEALAYWIMGDGTKTGKGLTLQTQSFTLKECVFIISILIHKFDLKCSIHMQRNLPTIYVSVKSMEQIRAKLLPYFIPSMLYKIS